MTDDLDPARVAQIEAALCEAFAEAVLGADPAQLARDIRDRADAHARAHFGRAATADELRAIWTALRAAASEGNALTPPEDPR